MSLSDGSSKTIGAVGGSTVERPSIVKDLTKLVDAELRFRTILADPPWRYSNTASRAAAENHYRTMTVDQICNEPISQLVTDSAHLHLWTTNAFLEAAFTVIRAWGFEYKSCLVWAKPNFGMGNYWRVSHEFPALWDSRPPTIRAKRCEKLGHSSSHAAQPKAISFSRTHRASQPRSLPRTVRSRRTTEHWLDCLRKSSGTAFVVTRRSQQ